MYPAQSFFDGLYTEEDLPDELTINPFDLGNESVVVFRDGLVYGPHEFFEGYAQEVTILASVEFDTDAGPQWVLRGTAEDDIFDNLPCLFQEFGGNFFGPGLITDNFADTYKITVSNDGFIEEFIVTRCGLCVWADNCDPEDRLATLRFLDGQRANPLLPNVKPEWEAQAGAEQIGIKIGPLNTPVGSYSANTGTIEVSAA